MDSGVVLLAKLAQEKEKDSRHIILVVLIPIRWTIMPDSRHVDNAGFSLLDKESQSVSTDDRTPVPDSCLQACNAARLGIRSLCRLVCGVGWNPALFTRSLDECASKVGSTFGNYKHPDRRILIETAAFNELLATLEETAATLNTISSEHFIAKTPCPRPASVSYTHLTLPTNREV